MVLDLAKEEVGAKVEVLVVAKEKVVARVVVQVLAKDWEVEKAVAKVTGTGVPSVTLCVPDLTVAPLPVVSKSLAVPFWHFLSLFSESSAYILNSLTAQPGLVSD